MTGPQIYGSDPIPCPGCAVPLFAHLCPTPPTPGDTATLCAHCSTISMFTIEDGQLALRRPTDAELDGLLANPTVVGAIRAVKQAREGARP